MRNFVLREAIVIKIVSVIGAPASGKTTLFRALLKRLGPSEFVKNGLVVYHMWPDKQLVVLGDYRNPKGFAGTDKLSMAVQPDAVRVLKELTNDPFGWTVMFEGDRLGTGSFLSECKKLGNLTCWVLETSAEVTKQRHKDRGDTQSDIWLQGRDTKVQRIAESFPVERKQHETPEDTRKLSKQLFRLVG